MPRSLLIILFVCIGFGTKSPAVGSISFTGLWDASNGDVSDFSLDLIQTGNHIEGYHTAIAQSGKRIDAVLPKEGPPSIIGTISDGVAHVRFRSAYDEGAPAQGEATLTLRGDKLEWKITNSSGVHYFPNSSVLYRQKDLTTGGQNTAVGQVTTGSGSTIELAEAKAQKVSIQNGNVCISSAGGEKVLTSSGHDSEPALSPDGKWICFVRTIPGKTISTGSGDADATQLWQIRDDGKNPTVLVHPKDSDKMETVLTGFSKPQFSTNGRLVYFLSEAWATSGALHVVDSTNGKEHFVCPALEFEVIPSGEYRDCLLVAQHRYFIGGGTYDWFWLLRPDGKEVGPVGEDTENFKATYLKE